MPLLYFLFGVMAELQISHLAHMFHHSKGGNLQILPKSTLQFSVKAIFYFHHCRLDTLDMHFTFSLLFTA